MLLSGAFNLYSSNSSSTLEENVKRIMSGEVSAVHGGASDLSHVPLPKGVAEAGVDSEFAWDVEFFKSPIEKVELPSDRIKVHERMFNTAKEALEDAVEWVRGILEQNPSYTFTTACEDECGVLNVLDKNNDLILNVGMLYGRQLEKALKEGGYYRSFSGMVADVADDNDKVPVNYDKDDVFDKQGKYDATRRLKEIVRKERELPEQPENGDDDPEKGPDDYC